MKRLICCALLATLAGCQAGDWQTRQTALAEAQMRTEVQDPAAQFSRVQVTGDQSTGQICGYVQTQHGVPERFIVYIDGTAGPYVEGGGGPEHLAQYSFDSAWWNDCVKEGYQ